MQRLLKSIRFASPGLIGLLLALAFSPSSFAQAGVTGQVVAILQPTNGAVYPAPTNIQLIAKVSQEAGTLTNVTFYAGATKLGQGLPVVLDPPGIKGVTGLVYLFSWTNVPAGSYALTAVAESGFGEGPSYVSPVVNITVGQPTPAPVVRITSPPNHAVFFQPADIPLFAFAADVSATAAGSANSNSYIANVEFYADTNDLGPAQHVVVAPLYPQRPIGIVLPNEFTLVWSNAAPGQYALTAVATDGNGKMATSTPVNITVVPTKIITNGIDVVSIIASDPVAIAGTNCWVWPGLPVATPTWATWQAPSPPARVPFTNCGPKDATFTVRRAGSSSNALSVFYGITGTASNGVDYATLPGVVTIPAGENYAFINVVPLDTNASSVVKTVVLTLEPDPELNPVASYIVGIPKSAAAMIIDSAMPHPVTGPVPGRLFHLNAPGPDGTWFCVEASTDLIHWAPIATNQVINGCVDFVDPSAMGVANCYYQAVPQLSAPLQ